ncbi:MAG: hypothetical protein KA715_07120 [Xanthomonadaceae bacterium]|nr:hypothetical protein [Xanthomonadaceae bacterium]
MTKILRFFSHLCSLIVLLYASTAHAYEPELEAYSRLGIGAIEWGFHFFDYFTVPSPEERNPFLYIRLQQEQNKIKRKPVRSKLHWRLDAQMVSLTSSITNNINEVTVISDWVHSFRLGLGYRSTRDLDFDIHLSAEAAPGARLSTGGLEFDLTWFIKLPKAVDPSEKTRLINPLDLKKIKFERIQAQDYEDEDPEAPKIARYRPPRLDIKFSAGTYLHQKERGDMRRLTSYENYLAATSLVTQNRLGIETTLKWDKHWYSALNLAYYNYPKQSTDALAQILPTYTMTGAYLTGRFSRHSGVQGFPTFEIGASTTHVINSKKQVSLETWLSFYPFLDLSSVVWVRPSMKFEITEDWFAALSVDAGATRGGMLLLGGANVSRLF